MRDIQVFQALQALEAKVGEDTGLLLRTISMIETRQKALEHLLFRDRLSILKIALLQLISPSKARAALMMTHQGMLRDHNKKLKEAIESKNRMVKPSAAGSALISLAVLFVMLFTGCVKMTRYQALEREYVKMQTERDLAAKVSNYCTEQQVKLVEILRKFNQVDEKGALRKGKQ